MNDLEFLASDLPSPQLARQFSEQFAERNPREFARLQNDDGLLSDILALASYSPLLGTTLVQHPEYVSWLARERREPHVRDKDAILESLARFSLTNGGLDPSVLFARFRRRELLRVFLRDIRRLSTIAEITEEISNLADAILENALRIATQQMDNRFGPPQELDENGKQKRSGIVVVSLGKLGSKELNYSSDIDLLFIYSSDGETSGAGEKGSITNKEYFTKLAGAVNGLVGRQSGEGAAYRVDMRLRPHGRVGALALSLSETVAYYLNEARAWERQVLIRSRASAGDPTIFKRFFASVESRVFESGKDPNDALGEVFRSKEKIDREHRAENLFDVKLGRGGIREIEFIAQALQLAYGGGDKWLRASHTLISIARLGERGHLHEDEISRLAAAYEFLRRLEHILQMEHGLQTHSVPVDKAKLELVGAKMGFAHVGAFQNSLERHANNVHAAFSRVFGPNAIDAPLISANPSGDRVPNDLFDRRSPIETAAQTLETNILGSLRKLDSVRTPGREQLEVIRRIAEVSPRFAAKIASMPNLAYTLELPKPEILGRRYSQILTELLDKRDDRPTDFAVLRSVWSKLLVEIAVADIFQTIPVGDVRRLQTELAEATIAAGLRFAVSACELRTAERLLEPAILAFGKLGSGTLDYDSDLDLIAAYGPRSHGSSAASSSEAYSRIVGHFVDLLSGVTRAGSLYRVDLRLRPHGKNGPNVTTFDGFTEYILTTASPWELLAYVQMRAIAGNLAVSLETSAREAISQRVALEDRQQLRNSLRDMRLRLEENARSPSGRDLNIKFCSGGLLDVYFVVRYLQLLHPTSVRTDARSTSAKLRELNSSGHLGGGPYAELLSGHEFLSSIDHFLRLSIGRSSKLPISNRTWLGAAAARIGLPNAEELLHELGMRRLSIRESFDSVFST